MKDYKVRFGDWNKPPQQCEPVSIQLPDDTLFYTAGENDVGTRKYIGALHYMCLTKADDKVLENISTEKVRPFLCSLNNVRSHYLRINGWAIICLHDAVFQDKIDCISEEALNETLCTDKSYIVCLNEQYRITNVIRLRRIHSETSVICDNAQHYLSFGNGPWKSIEASSEFKLLNLFNKNAGTTVNYLDNLYGELLFKEVLHDFLATIDPQEYKPRLIGYDLEWLANSVEESFADITDASGKTYRMFLGYQTKDDVDFERFKRVYRFEEELPLKY